MANRKIIYKIISYLIIALIFFFLGKTLFSNWQKVKEYEFSFNYFYLAISYLFLMMPVVIGSIIWNKILRILEPAKKLSFFKAFKIFLYAWFGRYLPGKIWMFVGRIYLGEKEGLSKKTLTISVIYEIVLSISSAFLFSVILLGIAFGQKFYLFYFFSLAAVIIGFLLVHPKIFYFWANFVLRKIKKPEIPLDSFLNYRRIIQLVFYYFIFFAVDGLSFFFLIKSIVPVAFSNIVGIIGSYVLASILGIIALFAPSGLGVREGTLSFFLQFYFPLTIAVLISLLARIWTTIGEVALLTITYLYSRFKRVK